MNNDFGNRLRDCRKLCKMKQRNVGREISVTGATISSWESGKRSPSVEMIIKLCNVLNVSADYLLGLDDQIEKTEKMEIDDDRFSVDFNSLDDDGKFLIRTILDVELYRCKKKKRT